MEALLAARIEPITYSHIFRIFLRAGAREEIKPQLLPTHIFAESPVPDVISVMKDYCVIGTVVNPENGEICLAVGRKNCPDGRWEALLPARFVLKIANVGESFMG